jgi:hypothetical protein
VFTLVRALSAIGRSAVLTLIRGLRRGEVRFYRGEVTSAQVGLIHGQAALHQLLLWTDARFDFAHEDIVRRQQIPLDADELWADAERFLDGVRDSAGGLSPAMVLEQDVQRVHNLGKQIPTEVHGVLRMFDGHRVLADVLEDSPYRVFETLRVAQKAVEVGLLRIADSQKPKATWKAVLAVEEWLVGKETREAVVERTSQIESGPAESKKKKKRGKRAKKPKTPPVGVKADIDWGALVPRVIGAEVGPLSGVVPASGAHGEIDVATRARPREGLEALMDTDKRTKIFPTDIGLEPSVVVGGDTDEWERIEWEAKEKIRAEDKARAEAEAKADADAKAAALAEAEAKLKAAEEAEAKAKAAAEAEAGAKAEAEKAKAEAAQAKAAAEKAEAEMWAKAKADAEAQAKADAEAQAKADAEAKATADAEAKAKAAAEAQAAAEAKAKAELARAEEALVAKPIAPEAPAASFVATPVAPEAVTSDAVTSTFARVEPVSAAIPSAQDVSPSDGIVRPITASETEKRARERLREPPRHVPEHSGPEVTETSGELGRKSVSEPAPRTSEPSILVADLASAHAVATAAIDKAAAQPPPKDAASPSRELEVSQTRNDAIAASEAEEAFFQRADANRPSQPHIDVDNFDDLDEGYEPPGFWDRVFGRKGKKKP